MDDVIRTLDSMPPRDRPVVLEAFSTHVARAITTEGIKTYGELADSPMHRLLRHLRVGRKGLYEVEVELLRVGVEWRCGMRYDISAPKPELAPAVVASRGVYFFACCGWVKIGWARNIRTRVMNLACANPFPTHLGAVVYTASNDEAKQLERHFHRRFKHLRHRGEWFQDDPSIWAAAREQWPFVSEVA